MATEQVYRLIAGRQNRYQNDFLKNSMAGIDLLPQGYEPGMSRREVQVLLQMEQPHARSGQVNSVAGEIEQFLHQMQIDDLLIMYHMASDRFIPGTITSEVQFDPESQTPAFRQVSWLPEPRWIPKRDLSFGLNGLISAASLIIKLWPEHQTEIRDLLERTNF